MGDLNSFFSKTAILSPPKKYFSQTFVIFRAEPFFPLRSLRDQPQRVNLSQWVTVFFKKISSYSSLDIPHATVHVWIYLPT